MASNLLTIAWERILLSASRLYLEQRIVIKLGYIVGFSLPILLALPDPVFAQAAKTTSAGRPVVVRTFFNCVRDRYPNAAASASHGTVVSRETRRNRCGNPNQPVVDVVYTPNPGFRGTDEVIFHGGMRARTKIIVR